MNKTKEYLIEVSNSFKKAFKNGGTDFEKHITGKTRSVEIAKLRKGTYNINDEIEDENNETAKYEKLAKKYSEYHPELEEDASMNKTIKMLLESRTKQVANLIAKQANGDELTDDERHKLSVGVKKIHSSQKVNHLVKSKNKITSEMEHDGESDNEIQNVQDQLDGEIQKEKNIGKSEGNVSYNKIDTDSFKDNPQMFYGGKKVNKIVKAKLKLNTSEE